LAKLAVTKLAKKRVGMKPRAAAWLPMYQRTFRVRGAECLTASVNQPLAPKSLSLLPLMLLALLYPPACPTERATSHYLRSGLPRRRVQGNRNRQAAGYGQPPDEGLRD
jgi:hypothetical protein